MSDFSGINKIIKAETVNFIVPERIREACTFRDMSYFQAAKSCDIDINEFGSMANGHKQIPNEYIFKLMNGFDLPKGYFYRVRWERV